MNIDKRLFIFAFIIFFSIMLIVLVYKLAAPSKSSYISNEKLWIDTIEDSVYVNLTKAAARRAYQDGAKQVYRDGNIYTSFSQKVIYEGNTENYEYSENNRVFLRFTNDMIPNDGIPEGYILEKFENKKPVAYIFIDEDFADEFDYVNIVWGKNLQYEKEFSFDILGEGIYYDRIEDDINRFSDNFRSHSGGIYAGYVFRDDLANRNYKRVKALNLV
jgi:hypothetical protein